MSNEVPSGNLETTRVPLAATHTGPKSATDQASPAGTVATYVCAKVVSLTSDICVDLQNRVKDFSRNSWPVDHPVGIVGIRGTRSNPYPEQVSQILTPLQTVFISSKTEWLYCKPIFSWKNNTQRSRTNVSASPVREWT